MNNMNYIISKILIVLFSIYITGVFHFTLLGRDVTSNMQYELSLFWSYKIAWETEDIAYWKEIVYNILLLMPLGVLLPLTFKVFRACKWTILFGFFTSLIIELSQLVFKIGLFEFDDLFNNTMGAFLGYCFFELLNNIYLRSPKWKRNLLLWLAPIFFIGLYFVRMWWMIENSGR